MASRVLRLWNPDLAAWEPVGDPRLSGYLPLTGGTLTGPLSISGAAATDRSIFLQTTTSNRWEWRATNAAETGSNAGSNLEIHRYSDAAADLGTALTITRATGAATFGGAVTAPALTLEGAAAGTYVLNHKLAADTQPRFRVATSGLHEWGAGGASAPDTTLTRTQANVLQTNAHVQPTVTNTYGMGGDTRRWNVVYGTALDASSHVKVTNSSALSGAVRLANTGTLAWRNAANTADLTLGVDASDRLALAVGAGSLTTSATAGAATALPATPAIYLTVVLNGTTYKVPGFAV